MGVVAASLCGWLAVGLSAAAALARRTAGLEFTAEEKAKLGLTGPRNLLDIMKPQPVNIGALNRAEV